MKTGRARRYLTWVVVALLAGCVEPYVPDDIPTNPDYLVVDGMLNASTGEASIALSRVIGLTSPAGAPQVSGAQVTIEDERGGSYPLAETMSGKYSGGLSVDPATRYRVAVRTPEGKRYHSDFVAVKITPPIEQLGFQALDDELRIVVSTRDRTGANKYYRWTFSETWEYTSVYTSSLVRVGDEVVSRPIAEQINRCWRTDPSYNVLVGSTTQLTENVISNFRLHGIARNSSRLSIRYSINVRQMAISEQGYTYWLDLMKTTENLGGLFDPMPGQVIGNIRNADDPGEVVIGYFDVSTVEEKRIFITPPDLPDGYMRYRLPFCAQDTIGIDEIGGWPASQPLINGVYSLGFPVLIGYTTSESVCIDCREYGGGTTQRPHFWP